MNLFDFFRPNQRPTAQPSRHVRKSPRRILGSHFEWLEPRCLMSIAPPAPIVSEPDNAQYTSFYVAPLVPRGHFPSALPPVQQLQLQPVQDSTSGIAILNGMSNIGGLSASHGRATPNATTARMFNYEYRAVQEMLQSLKYVPPSPSGEIQDQPTLVTSAPTIAPALPTIAPPFSGKSPSSLGSAPSLSSPPSLPISRPAAPSNPPSLPASTAPSPSSSPSLPASKPSSPSSAPSIFRSEPSTSINNAPTLASPDSFGRQGAQHNTEGGMVSLVRQPVAQTSAVDKISVAAIDALLEIPAKVDGMQGRFQAFEISVTTERPLPVAPLPAGAQINLPVESNHAITPPDTDLNLHGAWVPPDSVGAIPPLNLSSEEFASAALFTAASPLPEDASPFAELPHAAIDAVFGELSSESTDNSFSIPRLDAATATLLAVVIGRALWPTRAPKSGSPEKTATSRDAE